MRKIHVDKLTKETEKRLARAAERRAEALRLRQEPERLKKQRRLATPTNTVDRTIVAVLFAAGCAAGLFLLCKDQLARSLYRTLLALAPAGLLAPSAHA